MADARRKMQLQRDSLKPTFGQKHTVDFVRRFDESRLRRLEKLATIPPNELS